MVIPTDEELVVAREAERLLENLKTEPIPFNHQPPTKLCFNQQLE
jgi:hypothetical protein